MLGGPRYLSSREKTRNAYKILVGKHFVNIPPQRLKKTGEAVIQLDLGKVPRQALALEVFKISFYYHTVSYLAALLQRDALT